MAQAESTDIVVESYHGCEVLMMKSNGYVNITKLCKDHGKNANDWFFTSLGSVSIPFLINDGLSCDNILIDRQDVKNEYRGIYAHTFIADKLAQWISDKIGYYVIRIIEKYMKEDIRRQVEIEKIKSTIQKYNIQKDEICRIEQVPNTDDRTYKFTQKVTDIDAIIYILRKEFGKH